MTRRHISLIAALAVVAATFAVIVSSAQGTTFSDVNPLFCAFNGGQTTRPAGTELRLRLGENSYNRGNLIAWRNAETTTVSINGGPLIDLTNNFDPITFEDPFYVTRNFYDTGIVLQPGVSVSVVYDLERNKVRAAYHRSEYLPERRKMMQEWADYLDEVQTSAFPVLSPSAAIEHGRARYEDGR